MRHSPERVELEIVRRYADLGDQRACTEEGRACLNKLLSARLITTAQRHGYPGCDLGQTDTAMGAALPFRDALGPAVDSVQSRLAEPSNGVVRAGCITE
jgi:hypothetical protein